MSLRLKASLLAALATIALAYGPGCAAPVLPIPPPTALIEAPDMDGFVTITGEARPGALVYCFHEETGTGVIVTADATSGAYSLRIAAATGDALTVWQSVGGGGGMLRDLIVP